MPEVVTDRVGSLFYHRDTRLRKTGHPVIVKSVDVTDLSPRFMRHQIRFDYGFGGDRRLYAEVQIYRPMPNMHWTHKCFDVAKLLDEVPRPDDLRRLARTLRISQARLITSLVVHAPWRLADPSVRVWN